MTPCEYGGGERAGCSVMIRFSCWGRENLGVSLVTVFCFFLLPVIYEMVPQGPDRSKHSLRTTAIDEPSSSEKVLSNLLHIQERAPTSSADH